MLSLWLESICKLRNAVYIWKIDDSIYQVEYLGSLTLYVEVYIYVYICFHVATEDYTMSKCFSINVEASTKTNTNCLWTLLLQYIAYLNYIYTHIYIYTYIFMDLYTLWRIVLV